MTFNGKLHLSLGDALTEFEKIQEDLDAVLVFWSLRSSQDMTDDAIRRRKSNIDTRSSRLHTDYLAFVSHEVARMPAEVLNRLLETDARAHHYQAFIERLRQRRAYLLPEGTEKALGARRPWTTPDIAVKAYRKQLSSATFRLEGNAKELSYTEIRALLRSPSHDERHSAQAAVKRGILENRVDQFAALALNLVVGSWIIECDERGYASARSRRNVRNNVSDQVVSALISAVKSSGTKLARRALLLKKQLLASVHGVRVSSQWSHRRRQGDRCENKTQRQCVEFRVSCLTQEFSYVDRLAPVTLRDDAVGTQKLSWRQTVDIVRTGFSSFSSVFSRLFEKLLAEGRVDAAPTKGKQTGAFCSGGTPTTGPFILMNHTGTKQNVKTLAHEAGHAIHFMLAYEQGHLQYHPPLTLAETASIMGETIVFGHLLEQTKCKYRKLEMIVEHVDSLLGTIIRQISFDRSWCMMHGGPGCLVTVISTRCGCKRPGDSSSPSTARAGTNDCHSTQQFLCLQRDCESVHRLTLSVVRGSREFYGAEGEVFDSYKDIEKDWSGVHHFTKAPFYVYSYAFADLLVGSLLAARERDTDGFEEKLISLLRAGDTLDLETALAPFGLNPSDPSFWTTALELRLGSLINEAEKLAQELGYISSAEQPFLQTHSV
ncbi:peptidase family m3 protein [Cystoisospora suis]|uniref:Peptidase family m3 protein n=1 Tax=Cystoisospora suis TaxID=483139 RepID=A0A2C6KQ14_9APIC|nr:peptidase family m3 protein [Cystoisospora suis]